MTGRLRAYVLPVRTTAWDGRVCRSAVALCLGTLLGVFACSARGENSIVVASATVDTWPATVSVAVRLDVDVPLDFLRFTIDYDRRYLTTERAAVIPDPEHFAPGWGAGDIICTVSDVDEETARIAWSVRDFNPEAASVAAGKGVLVTIAFVVEEAFARVSTPLVLGSVEATGSPPPQAVSIPIQTSGLVTDESLGLAGVFAPGVDNGAYAAGAVLGLQLDFSGPVSLVGGSLHVGLSSGGTMSIGPFASLASVPGTYEVGVGENTEALDVVSLSLVGGATLQGQGAEACDLRLPAAAGMLSETANVVIDTVAPTAVATWVNATTTQVTYSEVVQGAHIPGNYTFVPVLAVASVVHHGGFCYHVTTSGRAPAQTYTLSVDSTEVVDRAGNAVVSSSTPWVGVLFSLDVSGCTPSRRLLFGLAEQGGDGLDDGLDEVLGDGESCAYLVGPPTVPAIAGLRLGSDYRGPEAGITRWRFATDAIQGREEVTLDWDVSADLSEKGMYLQRLDGETAVGAPIDMKGASSHPVVPGLEYEIAFGPLSAFSADVGPGWNLIGLPVMTAAPAAGLFGSRTRAAGRAGPLWVWEEGGFRRHDDSLPLAAERGCWVYCVGAGATAVVDGIVADGLVELVVGWNLVSPAGPTPVPRGAAILGPAWCWDTDTRTYVGVHAGDDLLPGRAYWIKASQATSIRTRE